MLNRYEVEGLAEDVFIGKKVAVVGHNNIGTFALKQLHRKLDGTGILSDYSLASGTAQIRTNTGGVAFSTSNPDRLRGMRLDIIILVGIVDRNWIEIIEHHQNLHKTEVIRSG